MQAEVSESAHYEAMSFVDHPHPGQGENFDDEVPVALPGKKGKEWNKGETMMNRIQQSIYYLCMYIQKIY